MPKRRYSLGMYVSILFLLTFAACGSNTPTSTTPTTFQVPANDLLYALDAPASTAAPQHLIGFHPNGGAPQITLDAGLLSYDHQRVYNAIPHNGQTTVTIKNTQTGTTLHQFSIPGSYSTQDGAYANAVLSFDGHWLALRRQDWSRTQTTIALLDTSAGSFKTIRLAGHYDLDAVSPNGSRLYVLEQEDDQGAHYHVRRYDVEAGQLTEGFVTDKQDVNENMSGAPLARQMAKDGRVVYTLYTDPAQNIAFVHILPLISDYNGARCIGLPTGRDRSLLRYYTLTLSPDSTTLYAANAALGFIRTIAVNNADAVFDDQIISAGNFALGTGKAGASGQALYNGMVVSADQKNLYIVGASGIWAANARTLKIERTYAPAQSFTGIALSSNGRTLYAVQPDNGLTIIDLASGQFRLIAPFSALKPWGITWVQG